MFFAANWMLGWWNMTNLSLEVGNIQRMHCCYPQNHQFRKKHLSHTWAWVSLHFCYLMLVPKIANSSAASWPVPACLGAVTSHPVWQASLCSAASRMIRWLYKLARVPGHSLSTILEIKLIKNYIYSVSKKGQSLETLNLLTLWWEMNTANTRAIGHNPEPVHLPSSQPISRRSISLLSSHPFSVFQVFAFHDISPPKFCLRLLSLQLSYMSSPL